ncbi:MAG: prepilin-type N-terminal cleavage/methylation domain-containing protein [Victivallales bacterium]
MKRKKRILKVSSSKVRKFTLVELLIVIAIISILAGMLLPVLKVAKDKAKLIVCSGNMKQQGAVVAMYLNDYDGVMHTGSYPEGSGITDGSAGVAYIICLTPYLVENDNLGVARAYEYPSLILRKQANVFQCPAETSNLYYRSYGGNYYVFSRYELYGAIKRLKSPEITGLALDCYFQSFCPTGAYLDNQTIWMERVMPAIARHDGMQNVLFVDGHVDQVKGYNFFDDSRLRPTWRDSVNP